MHRSLLHPPAAVLYCLLAIVCAAMFVPFARVLGELYGVWNLQPEYSHGVIIPFLSAYLIWRRRDELRGLAFTGSWLGLAVLCLGLTLRWIGETTTMRTIEHYALLVVIYGAVLALIGPALFRRLWVPLLLLVFAMPLPSFFDSAVSLQLRLWSSQLGVWFIRAAGVSVLLEGNIIDLGNYKLEVADACSGLRYLLPLMTLAFIMAYLYRAPFWKRALVFLSSIPITVLMNSLRIGFIGITVDQWGESMAEGLLHDVEGWVVFMFSTLAVAGVALVLSKVGTVGRAEPLFHFDPPARVATPTADELPPGRSQPIPASFIAVTVLVVADALFGTALPVPKLSPPQRASFDAFPNQIGEWVGRREPLDSIYLNTLMLDDYVQTNYRSTDGSVINFYSAYYARQDLDRHVHSPRECIPGGGWEIQQMETRAFPGTSPGATFLANRAVIQQGNNRAIVYYWFQARERKVTNDYKMKWYLWWDALTRRRTDGALVRFVAPITAHDSEADVDARMRTFAAQLNPLLPGYIPE
jgi:exosortase D (VPLPA-CTERM-specific)